MLKARPACQGFKPKGMKVTFELTYAELKQLCLNDQYDTEQERYHLIFDIVQHQVSLWSNTVSSDMVRHATKHLDYHQMLLCLQIEGMASLKFVEAIYKFEPMMRGNHPRNRSLN
jgi:hypothetical protein